MLTLKKRTDTLRNLLCQTASEYQLHKAATKVRDARIQVLRARIGELSPALFTARQNKRIAKISDQIESLLATTPVEILTEFRRGETWGEADDKR
jgi:predicted  nucleic acid-binding Zn-ribbon protein